VGIDRRRQIVPAIVDLTEVLPRVDELGVEFQRTLEGNLGLLVLPQKPGSDARAKVQSRIPWISTDCLAKRNGRALGIACLQRVESALLENAGLWIDLG